MISSGEMSSAVAVSRGVSYLTIQTVVTTVTQVLAFAILTRIITPTQIGILAVLSLIVNLAQTINGAAFQSAATKYVGEYAGTNDGAAAGVVFQTLKVSLTISVPVAGFVFLYAGLLSRVLLGTASQAQLFRYLALDVLVYGGVLPVANGAVLGAKRFKAAGAIGTAGAILRQSLIIILILFLKDFIGLVYAWFLSDFAMFAAYCLYTVRMLGPTRNSFPIRKLMNFTWPLSIGNLVGFSYGWFDRAILIAFVPLASLGIYNAVLYAFGALAILAASFGNVLLPFYSRLSSGSLEDCRKATWAASRYVSLVIVPLAFGLFATAKPSLTLFVGEAYVGGVVPLMVLTLPYALTAFSLALSPMLTAFAKTRAVMWITISSLALALVSAYVLLPSMGIIAASVARGVATFVSLGLTIFVLTRIQVMRIDVEMTWKTLVAGAGMAGALVLTQMVIYSALLLPFYVLLGAVVYLILLRFLKAVRNHDIELIEKYLGSRLAFVARLLSVILLGRG